MSVQDEIEVLQSEIEDLEDELAELELDIESEEDERWQKRLRNIRTQLKYRLKTKQETLQALQAKLTAETQPEANESEPAAPEQSEPLRLFRKRRR